MSFEVLPDLLAEVDWAVITAPGEFTDSLLADPLFARSELARQDRFIVLDEVANQAGFPSPRRPSQPSLKHFAR